MRGVGGLSRGGRRLLAAGVSVVVLVGAAGIAFVYFGLMGGASPAKLTLSAGSSASPSATASSATVSTSATAQAAGLGTWSIASGSQAGYRVREQLGFAPAPSDAVGRTSSITGSITLTQTASGYSLTAASFTVDVSTLSSDRPMRDQRIHSMGLESDRYPSATFTLTSPITLPATVADGQVVHVQATGNLSLHGVTKLVTIPIDARLSNSRIEAAGSITFPFSEFGMTPPSIGGFVTVQSDATMEFDLFFQRG
jgi:polyisoprenoid-binding protein YceI